MSHAVWRRERRIALSHLGGISGLALLCAALLPGTAAAEAQYSCTGVGFVDPTSGIGVVDPANGSVDCITVPGTTLTLGGTANESADLEEPRTTTTYTYDDQTRLGSDSGGTVSTTTVYDDRSRLVSDTDSNGLTTRYTYDANNGEPATNTDRLGTVTQYDYNNQGQLADTRDAHGNITTIYDYNGQGQLTEVTDGAGNPLTEYTYDTDGTVHTIENLQGGHDITTTYTYDNGEVQSDSNTLGLMTTYDYTGNVITSMTDPNGRVTTFTYDGLGRVLTDTDTDGNTDLVFSQAVPEPASATLLGGGLIAFSAARRRMRAKG